MLALAVELLEVLQGGFVIARVSTLVLLLAHEKSISVMLTYLLTVRVCPGVVLETLATATTSLHECKVSPRYSWPTFIGCLS